MEKKPLQDRASLLADVAEMYYLEEKNQAEIAKAIGVTRSMVSRILTEARESGIVEIRIQRPLQSDAELESALKEKFGLKDIYVVVTNHRHAILRPKRSWDWLGAHPLAQQWMHSKPGRRCWSKWCSWWAPWALVTWNTTAMILLRVLLRSLAVKHII